MVKRISFIFLTSLCFITLLSAVSMAGEMDITGWEKGSEYDQLYDNTDREVFKGTLIDVTEITPMDGMTVGIGLVVKDKEDGEKVLVHLGPKDFVEKRIKGLRPGARVKVYGVLVEIGDEYEYMCAKLKAGEDRKYKFRLTKDGTPFWTLSQQELAQEESSIK